MSAFDRIELDHAGVGELLTSPEFHAAVQAAAEVVAETARGRGLRVTSGDELPITVFTDPNHDRVGVTVAIEHPAGVGMEAHHGVLKRAADAAGLSVGGLHSDDAP